MVRYDHHSAKTRLYKTIRIVCLECFLDGHFPVRISPNRAESLKHLAAAFKAIRRITKLMHNNFVARTAFKSLDLALYLAVGCKVPAAKESTG